MCEVVQLRPENAVLKIASEAATTLKSVVGLLDKVPTPTNQELLQSIDLLLNICVQMKGLGEQLPEANESILIPIQEAEDLLVKLRGECSTVLLD